MIDIQEFKGWREYGFSLLLGVAQIADGCVKLMSLGMCRSSFSFIVVFYKARNRMPIAGGNNDE